MLSLELAIGIRRVKGVKRLGRRIGNWLSGDEAQDLLNSIPQSTLRGKRDAALIGLLLGCGLRRSEAVSLRLDQLQLREDHWVIADLVGKGGRLRTVPVPEWCKDLIDAWLRDSGVAGGMIFRRISKHGTQLDAGVTTDVVWSTVKRHAKQIGIKHLAPHDLRRTCARLCHGAGGESNKFSFFSGMRPCKRRNDTSDAARTSDRRSMTDSESLSPRWSDNPVYYVVHKHGGGCHKTATGDWQTARSESSPFLND